MSELISQLELLRLMVDGRKPAQRAFSETGLDAELFERIYKLFRPGLEYLHGFRPIMHYFKDQPLQSPAMVTDAGMEKFDQVIEIACMGIGYTSSDGHLPLIKSEIGRYRWEAYGDKPNHRYVMINVYLTRSGWWLVWANYPTSRFLLVNTSDVTKAVEFFVPRNAWLRSRTPTPVAKFSASQSIPLTLADGLARAYGDSIAKKKRRLAQDETAQANAMNILDVIADY